MFSNGFRAMFFLHMFELMVASYEDFSPELFHEKAIEFLGAWSRVLNAHKEVQDKLAKGHELLKEKIEKETTSESSSLRSSITMSSGDGTALVCAAAASTDGVPTLDAAPKRRRLAIDWEKGAKSS